MTFSLNCDVLAANKVGRYYFLIGGAQNNLCLKAVKKNLQVLNQTKRLHECNIENEFTKQLSFY